tara:strand:- start:1588 stop:1899 length:312 start_codon:yes stop_codon:yes gene_type:complete
MVFPMMHFAGEGVSSGMVYAEMSVLVKNERAKITFDFGTEEDAKELRKEALWDKELQKETEFKSTVDAIKHPEAKQWMINSTSVAMDNGEIYKYFLLEKMNGF